MIYEIEEAREKILEACREMKRANLIARTWGNVSARISDKEFLITPSGKDYDEMTGEDLVKVRIRDEKWEGDLKPSSEKGMHARLYRRRPQCDFIIHTHQTNASALSILPEDLKLTGMSDSLRDAGQPGDGRGAGIAGNDSTLRGIRHVFHGETGPGCGLSGENKSGLPGDPDALPRRSVHGSG